MKKIILLFAFCTTVLQAQVETETIHFTNYTSETDNDFVNNFKFSQTTDEPFINQVEDGGIGFGVVEEKYGAIEPSNSVSWKNDSFVYLTNYQNTVDEVLEVSISFYYNADLVNIDEDQKPIGVWLRGETNNHDVEFYVDDENTLAITSYSYNESTQISLESNNWYKLVVKYQSIGGDFGDEVFVNAKIYDIGETGIFVPELIGNHEATIYDTDLIDSSELEIHLSASKDGGSEFLDNFIFKGVKGSDNTLSASSYNEILSKVLVYPNPTTNLLTIKSEESINNIEILDLTGRVIRKEKELEIDITNIINGNYIVKINYSNGRSSEKRIIKLD